MRALLIVVIAIFTTIMSSQAQVRLTNGLMLNGAEVKMWDMSHNGTHVARVYTIEPGAQVELSTKASRNGLVLAGTYTAPSGAIAGHAAVDGSTGDTSDPFTDKANAWLSIGNGEIALTDYAMSGDYVQVYRVINQGVISRELIGRLTSNQFQWRFLVQKDWKRKGSSGTDWMIVDFETAMTLMEATAIVAQLERKSTFGDGYTSTISAALLDTGMYRAHLINGVEVEGRWQQPSNMIIIK